MFCLLLNHLLFAFNGGQSKVTPGILNWRFLDFTENMVLLDIWAAEYFIVKSGHEIEDLLSINDMRNALSIVPLNDIWQLIS